MAENVDGKAYMDLEDELNAALVQIGKNREDDISQGEKVAILTVQELLKQIKIDEFEKMYITAAAQGNSPNKEQISEEKFEQVKTLAEFHLEQRNSNEILSLEEQEKIKNASNFYVLPHTVNQRYAVGNVEQTKQIDLYTINDVEGHSLYTIMNGQNIAITARFEDRIKKYLQETYPYEVETGVIKVDEVINFFTPENMAEMYEMLSKDEIISFRFLPDRVDEFVKSKGIQPKGVAYKEIEMIQKSQEKDNLDKKNKVVPKKSSKEEAEKNEIEKSEKTARVPEKGKEEEKHVESYIEKIAKLNHVSPAVVNTRVVENYEKVQEDTGIKLKGRYPRGEVIAVRIPYKLSYRTFLVEKSTGMTIDGKGRMDRKPGKLYDYDEIEDYFRYRLRAGIDGGESGKPLRYDEGRDYTTYIDEHGNLKEKKYVNNREKDDMIREERQRYLQEVAEADIKLRDAIDKYQKNATHENYKKVQEIINKKIEIDNRYNALDEQRKVTKETKENSEKIIGKEIESRDDDEWFPSFPGERFR